MFEKLCNACFTLTVTLGCVAEPTPLLAAPAPKGEGQNLTEGTVP